MAIHAAVLVAFLCGSTLEGPVLPRPSRDSGEPIVRLDLLPVPSPPEPPADPSATRAAQVPPRPAILPPARSQIEADRSARPTAALAANSVVQSPRPSAADPQAEAAQGAVASAANHPIAIDPAAGIDYRQRLLLHIAGFRRRSAFSGGDATGTVRVRFAIRRDGSVSAVAIVAGSGVAELDDEAVATIWRAEPMPPIPTVLPDSLSITLPIAFGVDGRGRG